MSSQLKVRYTCSRGERPFAPTKYMLLPYLIYLRTAISMELSTTHALKEWATAVDALEKGKTILLLRKGGIHEQGGLFKVAYEQVLLYPTFEHQQPHLLKLDYASQVKPVQSGWHPATVRIASYAQITDILLVAQEPAIKALLPYHIWNEEFVRDRLKWKPQQPIYLLLLRTYKLSEIHTIPYCSEYGGCKSWIDLSSPISLEDTIPVLDDAEYAKQATAIRQALARP